MISFSLRTLVLIACFFSTSAFASATLDHMVLKWSPTTELKSLAATNLGAFKGTLKIEKLKDARTVTPINKVGENREKAEKGIVLPVLTHSDVSDFVTTHLDEVFKKAGLSV